VSIRVPAYVRTQVHVHITIYGYNHAEHIRHTKSHALGKQAGTQARRHAGRHYHSRAHNLQVHASVSKDGSLAYTPAADPCNASIASPVEPPTPFSHRTAEPASPHASVLSMPATAERVATAAGASTHSLQSPRARAGAGASSRGGHRAQKKAADEGDAYLTVGSMAQCTSLEGVTITGSAMEKTYAFVATFAVAGGVVRA
jgi:hypothetical protein